MTDRPWRIPVCRRVWGKPEADLWTYVGDRIIRSPAVTWASVRLLNQYHIDYVIGYRFKTVELNSGTLGSFDLFVWLTEEAAVYLKMVEPEVRIEPWP